MSVGGSGAANSNAMAQQPCLKYPCHADWCDVPPGYTLGPAKDSVGSNIGPQLSSVQTPASLAALCDGTADCVGFTSTGPTGWLKSAIKAQLDPAAVVCQGLFVRNGEARVVQSRAEAACCHGVLGQHAPLTPPNRVPQPPTARVRQRALCATIVGPKAAGSPACGRAGLAG